MTENDSTFILEQIFKGTITQYVKESPCDFRVTMNTITKTIEALGTVSTQDEDYKELPAKVFLASDGTIKILMKGDIEVSLCNMNEQSKSAGYLRVCVYEN